MANPALFACAVFASWLLGIESQFSLPIVPNGTFGLHVIAQGVEKRPFLAAMRRQLDKRLQEALEKLLASQAIGVTEVPDSSM
jgi:hypothetical protein